MPLDQLCLSPQCGFASTEEGNILAEDEQWAKLANDRGDRRRGVGIVDGNDMHNARKPPFRADHVGSLLRPAALKEAREQRAKGEITPAHLKEIEDREIERVIKKQEEVGLQSITDGEFRRSWWHLDFLWGLDGIEKHVMDTGIAFAARDDAQRRPQGHRQGRLFRPSDDRAFQVRRRAHQAHAEDHHPGAVGDLWPPDAHADRQVGLSDMDEFFADLGQAYKKAVRAFADAGCRYLQLDEVFIAMLCDPKYRQQMKDRGDDPEQLGELYGDLINTAMSDIPVRHDDHHASCAAAIINRPIMGAGGYEACRRSCSTRSRCTAIFMEYDSDRAGDFEPLRLLPKDKTVVLGLVTSKPASSNPRTTIKRRIDEAAKFVPLDQLCLSPQCGFASTEEGNALTEDEQWAKLRMIVEVADEVWGKS